MIDVACAWLREPPEGSAVVVVGAAFVIVRDGDVVLAYELPRSAAWHEAGVTLDEIERHIGRVLWREAVSTVVEVETEQGMVAIVPALDTRQVELLERGMALVCGRLDAPAPARDKLLTLVAGAELAAVRLVDGRVIRA